MLRKMQDAGQKLEPVLRSMGTTFLSITVGNFNQAGASLRPAPWKNKLDGTPSRLKQSGLLSHSFFLRVSPTQAVVGNPTVYAAIHQFGGEIKPKNSKALRFRDSAGNWHTVQKVTMPARPFFPVNQDGTQLTPAAERLVTRAAERTFMRRMGMTT